MYEALADGACLFKEWFFKCSGDAEDNNHNAGVRAEHRNAINK